MQTVYFKALHNDAILPEINSDTTPTAEIVTIENGELQGGETRSFRTGLCVDVPHNLELEIRPLDKLAKDGVILVNSPMTIFAEDNNEIIITLHNLNKTSYKITRLSAIAKCIALEAPLIKYKMKRSKK